MGRNSVEPEARVYVCSECFGKVASFMLTNPSLIKQMGFPKSLTAHPVDGEVAEPCEKCNFALATGYILCSPPKNRIAESVERVGDSNGQ